MARMAPCAPLAHLLLGNLVAINLAPKHGQIPMFLRSGNGQYHKEQAQGRGKNGGSNRITYPFRVDEERKEPYLEPCLILPCFHLFPIMLTKLRLVLQEPLIKRTLCWSKGSPKKKSLCPTVTKSIESFGPKIEG